MSTISRDESILKDAVPRREEILVPLPPQSFLTVPNSSAAAASSSSSPSSSSSSSAILSRDNKEIKEKVIIDKELLPHPAEDLSADDDLLSWILVDQLGCMPNTKLGVHPQQVKFVGPPFKTDDVLNIVKETVTKGNLQGAMQRLQEFHLIKSHLQSKMTDYQRERFTSHLRRYLLPLLPNSRLEIHLTSRYSFITGHTELAIFATRPLTPGLVMQELQGSVVPLPDQWREEMEIGEDFAVAVEAAGEETDSEDGSDREDDNDDNDDNASLHSSATNVRRDKGKSREVENGQRKGQRRSDRTKRRDFSIVWSGLKRCYQLFLGPARFLNHDCNPNVELLRQGKFVTFRVLKPIRVGDELTTFYGENYFGRNNIECLCLTCEQKCIGGFTPTPVSTTNSGRDSRSRSIDSTAGSSRRGTSADMRESVAREIKNVGPSSLRNVVNGLKDQVSDDDEQSIVTGNPSQVDGDDSSMLDPTKSEIGSESINATPKKKTLLRMTLPPSPTTESVTSEPESPIDPPPRRERIIRKVVQNIKPWSFLQRPKKFKKEEEPSEIDEESGGDLTDEYPSDFPRCGTCAKPLTEQIWFNGRYFEHCARCVRHAFIFELPWPAHKPQDVREYPPTHLIPPGYIPRKISIIPLPTLSKQPKFVKPIEVPVSPSNETKAMRRARRLRDQIAAEEFFIESLREAAWSAQEAKEAAIEAKEAAIKALKESKEAEKKQRAEEKRQRDAMNIKGSGVWSRYAYISEAELKKKEAEKNQVLSGTRRGGRFRAKEDEEEMKKLAQEKLREEEKERLLAMGIEFSSHSSDSENNAELVNEDEQEIIERVSNNSISSSSSSAISAQIIVDPESLRDHIQNKGYGISSSTRTPTTKIKSGNQNQDEKDEMEVATAPELSIVKSSSSSKLATSTYPPSKKSTEVPKSKETPSKATDNKLPVKSQSSSNLNLSNINSTTSSYRPIAPKPASFPIIDLTRPFPQDPRMKTSSSSRTINTSPNKLTSIIDLTFDSDGESSSNSSGIIKKTQGRPLGSGKHQKAAARKLAKSQSTADPSPKTSTPSLPPNDKGKGKAIDHSPKASKQPVIPSAPKSHNLSPIASTAKPFIIARKHPLGFMDVMDATKMSYARPSERPLPVTSTPTASKQTNTISVGDRTVNRTADESRSGSGSGSGSGSSSVDMTEVALGISNGSLSSLNNNHGGNNEKRNPKLILNVSRKTIPKDAYATMPGFKGGKVDQWKPASSSDPPRLSGLLGKLKEQPKPLLSNVQLTNPPNVKSTTPKEGQIGNGNFKNKEMGTTNGSAVNGNGQVTFGLGEMQSIMAVDKQKPSSSSSLMSTLNPSNGNVIDKKRKRVSEASETSSTSSPSSSHTEKKKRTFFPPLISVAVAKPTQPIPLPKHSIHK